jgi:hypothetical protein
MVVSFALSGFIITSLGWPTCFYLMGTTSVVRKCVMFGHFGG